MNQQQSTGSHNEISFNIVDLDDDDDDKNPNSFICWLDSVVISYGVNVNTETTKLPISISKLFFYSKTRGFTSYIGSRRTITGGATEHKKLIT